MLKQIKEANQEFLENPIYIGILPNNGEIIDGYPQAILAFNDEKFTIYTFKGIRKFSYDNKVYSFKFSDITEMEMGKYNFKNLYIKIIFEQKFIAFQYFLKIKTHPEQETNINLFIKKLESIATKIEE